MSTTAESLRARLDVAQQFPAGMQAMMGLEKAVKGSSLDARLLNLVKLRASQINGCAFCVDMHAREGVKLGESDERLHGLVAWQHLPFYDERERAALALTEATTAIAESHVPDDVYAETASVLGEQTTAELIVAIATINAWNRIAIASRMVPGSFG